MFEKGSSCLRASAVGLKVINKAEQLVKRCFVVLSVADRVQSNLDQFIDMTAQNV
jgi:hypothetical protein